MAATASFVRVVATVDGGSAFADGELELDERLIVEGMPALVGALPSATGVVYLQGGPFVTGAHPAPRKQWVIMLRGAVEVEVSDGSTRTFGAGDLLLVEDVTGSGHSTRTVGEPPFEGLFIPTG